MGTVFCFEAIKVLGRTEVTGTTEEREREGAPVWLRMSAYLDSRHSKLVYCPPRKHRLTYFTSQHSTVSSTRTYGHVTRLGVNQ